MYITVKQAAEKWGISDRRVRILCSEGKISGVTREGRNWMIPADAKKPEDGRFKAQGGFTKINKVFGNALESIVLELNEYLYDDGGKFA